MRLPVLFTLALAFSTVPAPAQSNAVKVATLGRFDLLGIGTGFLTRPWPPQGFAAPLRRPASNPATDGFDLLPKDSPRIWPRALLEQFASSPLTPCISPVCQLFVTSRPCARWCENSGRKRVCVAGRFPATILGDLYSPGS